MFRRPWPSWTMPGCAGCGGPWCRRSCALELAETFSLLGDPTRTRILHALSVDELCVSDLAGVLGISASAVSHQLRLLRDRRLVEVRRDGKRTYYRLQDEHIRTLVDMGMSHAAEEGRGRAAVRMTRRRGGAALERAGRRLPGLRERADPHLRRRGPVLRGRGRDGRGRPRTPARRVLGARLRRHRQGHRRPHPRPPRRRAALAGLGFRARPERGARPRRRRGPRGRSPRWP